MEFFSKAKAVRLKSHLNKYLVANDDQVSTRQSRHGTTRRARWLVELVDTNEHVVRLKSCHNRYLTASDEPFLLGMTGHKVTQTTPDSDDNIKDLSIEWQPIRDGFLVKLKSYGGSYLRANGGTPPWRNTVTHDSTHGANSWVVWDVEEVDVPKDEAVTDYWSMIKSFSSVSDDQISELGSPVSVMSGAASPSPSPRFSSLMKKISFSTSFKPATPKHPRTTAMDLFHNAKAVRLKSSHDKYLTADDDEESVTQDKNGSSRSAKWTVEFLPTSDHIIRLKSCYGKYLTASNHPFLLGMTGRKVTQTRPNRLDSSVEWEPIKENGAVKLKTRYGQYLRANGGLPPWRNSVTHDIPHRTATQEWIQWEVHVVEILEAPTEKVTNYAASDSGSPTTSFSDQSASFSRQESNDSMVHSPPKGSDGRLIYYHIANEHGEIDEGFEELCITFKGNGVQELTKRLEAELGLDGITVCTRSPLNGKLYPLRLQLPPNNATMHIVVVPSSSEGIDQLEAGVLA